MFTGKNLNFNLIRNSIKFSELASTYGVHFENNKAQCPFHSEKTASFHNYGDHAYCFGCGKKVDVIELEAHFNDVSRRRAAQSLMGKYKLESKSDANEDSVKYKRKLIAKRLLKRIAEVANKELNKNPDLYAYIKQRGLSEVDIDKYQIGYIPEDGINLSSIIKFNNEIEIAEQIGLIKSKKFAFKNRIILPVWAFGEIVYLTTRSVANEEPKYIHLKNSELLTKSIAFSENLSKDYCIVAEGIFDAIAFLKAGFPACALLGVNPGKNCKNELKKALAKLHFCFDSDQAGKAASYELAKELKGSIMTLNKKVDADEVLLKYGTTKFKQIVKRSIKNSRYYLNIVISEESFSDAIIMVASTESQPDKAKATNMLLEKYNGLGITEDVLGNLIDLAAKRDGKSKPKSASKEDNESYRGYFEGLVDLVEYKGEIHYLTKYEKELKIESCHEINGQTCYPPPFESRPPELILPRAENVLKHYKNDSDSQLYDDLIKHHKKISELPSDSHYILLVAWVFHTYLLDKFSYSPYIWLYALAERGKSRTGKGCIYIAYRGHHDISLREAHLIRWANDWKASLFLDIADIRKKAKSENSEDILYQRFESGATVTRVLYPEKGAYEDMVHYKIFGSTIVATNEPLHELLESRAIQINMPESDKTFEEDLDPKMFLELKERLVAFRARYLDKQLPDRAKPARGRLGDMLKPFSQILAQVKPEDEGCFQELVDVIQNTKMEEKSQSFEGKLFKTILDLEDRIKGGLLSVKVITKYYNSALDEKFKIDARNVGHAITKLGFDRVHKENGAYIVWDEGKINNLKKRFGLQDYKPRFSKF